MVEVRARGPSAWQTPLESVTRAKAQRVRRAGERLWAARYERDSTVRTMRFDVVAISLAPDGTNEIEWVRAAF